MTDRQGADEHMQKALVAEAQQRADDDQARRTHGWTDKQRQRQRQRQTDRQTEAHRQTETKPETQTETDRHTEDKKSGPDFVVSDLNAAG